MDQSDHTEDFATPYPEPEEGPSSLDRFGEFVRATLGPRRRVVDLPERIGKFRVIDELGAGTYGRVYQVHDPDLDCDRAAKIPTELVLANPTLRAEFLREARNLQRIDDHPNVVRVVQAGEDDGLGRPYFVMEYCPERSLATWLKSHNGHQANEKWAARLVAQVADGVHRIHQQNLCHRDLKPGNILLVRVGDGGDPEQPDFRPKVADMGLASTIDDPEATASLLEGPVGTLAYMAPEQVRGRRKEIGPTTDVYGLGAILFEVISGRRAYASSSHGEIFESLQSEQPSPSLKEARPGASRSMQTIVSTAMRKEARYRYASAAEMADDLKRLSDGRPVRGAVWHRKALYRLSQHRPAIVGLAVFAGIGFVAFEASRLADERRSVAWLRRLEAATPSDINGLIKTYEPRNADSLASMFTSDVPAHKLNAALALAGVRPDCAEYVVEHLLETPVEQVGPVARAVAPAVPNLTARLLPVSSQVHPKVDGKPAALSVQRRVNAALALFEIGHARAGSDVLADLEDPDARSMLVSAIGRAGIPASVILDLIADTETTAVVRRQLILALGGIPDAAWTAEARPQAIEMVSTLYANDPDPGVHGASKWLLKRWGRASRVIVTDVALAAQGARQGFDWRVDRSMLTFVTVDDPATGHRFEITDTEIPWGLYRQFVPKVAGPLYDHVLTDVEPVLGVTFLDSVVFANWFSNQAHIPIAFPPVPTGEMMPLASEVIRSPGFRLPTNGEFAMASRAGTKTDCYFGDLREPIKEYAFTADTRGRPDVQAVGLLKPNDFGLFDTIGNGLEFCHFDGQLKKGRINQASLCGGSGIQSSAFLSCVPRNPAGDVTRTTIPCGFRLARTLGPVTATAP